MLIEMLPHPHGRLLSAKRDPLTYKNFFEERSRSSFSVFGDLDFTGKDVLDVGCGVGANLVYLCDSGARSVTGIDISQTQANAAHLLYSEHHPELCDRIRFVIADAAEMPFPDESFDVLVAADTFEHVDNLEGVLHECSRVLRPSGLLYAYFPPFYAPWGAHMINWIGLPWCQVFFSEVTLINVARRREHEGKSVNSRLPAETRLDLGAGNRIPFVSHLTVRRFRNAVENSIELQVSSSRLLPPNWRSSRWIHLFTPINQIPFLQEVFTAKAFFVLKKAGETK